MPAFVVTSKKFQDFSKAFFFSSLERSVSLSENENCLCPHANDFFKEAIHVLKIKIRHFLSPLESLLRKKCLAVSCKNYLSRYTVVYNFLIFYYNFFLRSDQGAWNLNLASRILKNVVHTCVFIFFSFWLYFPVK